MVAAAPQNISSSPSSSSSSFLKKSSSNKSNGDAVTDETLPLSGSAMMQMIADPTNGAAVRFEDLTIDDDLTLLERVVRYVKSGIALQRLVHVKVLAETARIVGTETTLRELIPLLPPLVTDSEPIIRSNLATQLVFLSLSIMFADDSHFMTAAAYKVESNSSACTVPINPETITSIQFLPTSQRTYHEVGYKLVTTLIVSYLNGLLSDSDPDTRKAASESLVLLSLHIRCDDIIRCILPVPFRCLQQNSSSNSSNQQQENVTIMESSNNLISSTKNEDVKISCINLLADLASLPSFTCNPYNHNQCISPSKVAKFITPAVLSLSGSLSHGQAANNSTEAPSFRIRRAIVQAIPRIVSGTAADDVHRYLIPAFIRFSEDEMYRVRKSVGECLVDMSRSFMLLAGSFNNMTTTNHDLASSSSSQSTTTPKGRGAIPHTPRQGDTESQHELNEFSNMTKDEFRETIMEIRRKLLIGICSRLLKDSNKFVRHGMMQFLGPFLASFYPLDGSEGTNEDPDGVLQIFGNRQYHADNMTDHHMIANNSSACWGGVHIGTLGSQFFPHVHGMVNRMNNPTSLSPAMVLNPSMHPTVSCGVGNITDMSVLQKSSLMSESKSTKACWDSDEYLFSKIPSFIERFHNDAQVMIKILQHRDMNPPSSLDVSAITDKLIPHYVELANIVTGDENIDAEMRVYCAYSFPAILLLLGRDAWDSSLKKCFLSLCTGSPLNEIKFTIPPSSPNSVPLPVKRCLAASFHTICLILGPQVVMKSLSPDAEIDLITFFEYYFLKDPDEATTLNVIRNLPALLSLLSSSRRAKFLPVLFEIVTGEAMLGILAKKRSAMNTTQLNWRQRDMIAQILPYLIMLYRPYQVRQYLWPIVKLLMSDPVSIVREHVEWSIPILLRVYEPSNCNVNHDDGDISDAVTRKDLDMTKFSAEACSEVLSYLSSNLLHPKANKTTGPCGSSFGKRQCYCRIVGGLVLVIRLKKSEKRKTMVRKGKSVIHPFYNLNSDESRHLLHVLQNYLLPSCLTIKDDKVANVRQALFNCLRMMPPEFREQSDIKSTLRMLEEEVTTWDGDGIFIHLEKQADSVVVQSDGMKKHNFV